MVSSTKYATFPNRSVSKNATVVTEEKKLVLVALHFAGHPDRGDIFTFCGEKALLKAFNLYFQWFPLDFASFPKGPSKNFLPLFVLPTCWIFAMFSLQDTSISGLFFVLRCSVDSFF
jgi:hypothetical protein